MYTQLQFIPNQNLHSQTKIAQLRTPQLKRYHTNPDLQPQSPQMILSASLKSPISSSNNNKSTRQRHKTFYSTTNKLTTPYISRTKKSLQDQYADLVVQSVKKNYLIGNLKPYAIDTSIIDQFKQEVNRLEQVKVIADFKNIYNKQQAINMKLNKLLTTALQKNPKITKKQYKHLKNVCFIQSTIQDDHQNLMEDYQQQIKTEKKNKQKTITQINSRLLTQFHKYIDKNNVSATNTKKYKNKILQFKKQEKVVKLYSSHDDVYQPQRRMKDILKLEKDDYGIYSRSANRAIYFKKNSITSKNKMNDGDSQNEGQNKQSTKKIQKTFYKNYMGSYSQRKNILRHSGVSFKPN